MPPCCRSSTPPPCGAGARPGRTRCGGPRGDRRAQRLPGARRRHRHQPALTVAAAVEALSDGDRSPARRPATVLAALRPRRAARRPGQLRRDPLPARCAASPTRSPDAAGRRGRRVAAALTLAADAAYAAVGRPGRGHLLTVARAAADAAAGGRRRAATLADVVTARRGRRRGAALARTPEQLPALARAGVVDAGGRGLWCCSTRWSRWSPARRPSRSRRACGRAAGTRPAPTGSARREPGRSPATRCSSCSTPATRSRRCGERWPRSATRWSSSAPEPHRGTSTCTSTTSAPRSRPASRPAGRTGSR